MKKNEAVALQTMLNQLGYPVDIDGEYGPETYAAYKKYLDAHQRRSNTDGPYYELPPASKPWWTSQAQVGWLLTILLTVVSKVFDIQLSPEQWSPPILEVLSGISALVALWGNTTREAPIDKHLLLPGVRLPSRVSVPRSTSDAASAGGHGPFMDGLWGESDPSGPDGDGSHSGH